MGRSRSNVLEDESRTHFRLNIPSQWVVRDKPSDYGIDCEVEIFDEKGSPTGLVFWVQVKATDSKVKKTKQSFRFKANRVYYGWFYGGTPANKYLIFARRGIKIKNYLAVLKHLEQYRTQLEPKPKDWKGKWKGRKPGSYLWYEIQDAVDYYAEFEKPKVIYPNYLQATGICV